MRAGALASAAAVVALGLAIGLTDAGAPADARAFRAPGPAALAASPHVQPAAAGPVKHASKAKHHKPKHHKPKHHGLKPHQPKHPKPPKHHEPKHH